MRLNDCKAMVDRGHTAKQLRWQSILHHVVRKHDDHYELLAQGYINPDGIIVVPQVLSHYTTWEMLRNALGYYADASGWHITEDAFESYLLPENWIAP
jgi:hypothetical protein